MEDFPKLASGLVILLLLYLPQDVLEEAQSPLHLQWEQLSLLVAETKQL